MIRELSCVLIGAYTAVIVVGLMRLSQGQAAYDRFLDTLWGPVGIVFNVVAFFFALYHTVSWFNVTPKAMPLRMGDRRVPGGAIIGAHYAGWLAVSAVVLFLARA
jgi:fumarate reductase subunit C